MIYITCIQVVLVNCEELMEQVTFRETSFISRDEIAKGA